MFSPASRRMILLNRFFLPSSVQRGLYISTAGRDLLPYVVDHLVDSLWSDSLTRSNMVSLARETGNTPSRIGRIFWVDSKSAFDVSRVSSAARRRGLNPTRVLRTINVERALSAFQLQPLLEKISRPVLGGCSYRRNGSREQIVARLMGTDASSRSYPQPVWWMPLVVLSDVMGLFEDPDLNEADLRRAFQQFSACLSRLKQRAVVLCVLPPEVEVSSDRKYIWDHVFRLSQALVVPPPLVNDPDDFEADFDGTDDALLPFPSWVPLAGHRPCSARLFDPRPVSGAA